MLTLVSVVAATLLAGPCRHAADDVVTHGPFLGHAGPDRALVWARCAQEGVHTIVVTDASGEIVEKTSLWASERDDLCVDWLVHPLEPETTYEYRIVRGSRESAVYRLRTAQPDDARRATIAFGSCANEQRFPAQPVWGRMKAVGAEAIVLLGDTPYIDSTDLAVQRRRYREFYWQPDLVSVLQTTPFYATWDDHDFGRNDTDGNLEGKERSLRAFREFHPSWGYGSTSGGIYTSFRRGPIEVFLLDTRYFAGTGASPVSDDPRTLLGPQQWSWLRAHLATSGAPFKIIASGMVWNGAVRPGKQDHWMSYPGEREALFRFLGENEINGVVLVGGDIHRSRALRYPTTDLVGYELTELITSPMANTVIETANAPSPHLLHDVGHEQTFLLLEADTSQSPATLRARCLDQDGKILFEVALDARSLARK